MKPTKAQIAEHYREEREFEAKAQAGGITCACGRVNSWETTCHHTLVVEAQDGKPAIFLGSPNGGAKYRFVFDLDGIEALHEQLTGLWAWLNLPEPELVVELPPPCGTYGIGSDDWRAPGFIGYDGAPGPGPGE